MHTVELEPGLLSAFAALPDDGGAISMLNLLRFREHADYAGHPEQAPCSGREAYRRYMELAMPIVEAATGRMMFMGSCFGNLLISEGERWDDMLLLEYPKRGPFIEALGSERYRRIAFHRSASLLDSRLIGFRDGSASFLAEMKNSASNPHRCGRAPDETGACVTKISGTSFHSHLFTGDRS